MIFVSLKVPGYYTCPVFNPRPKVVFLPTMNFFDKHSNMILRLIFLFTIIILPLTAFGQAMVLKDKRIVMTTVNAPWMMTMAADGFKITQQKLSPDGSRGYFMMENDQTYVNASVFIEPAVKCKTSKECRDMVLNAGNPGWINPINKVSSEIGQVSYFEFLIPSFRGQPIQQQNLYAQFVENGYWVDLHISKVLYKKEDHVIFEDMVKSVKFDAKPKPKV